MRVLGGGRISHVIGHGEPEPRICLDLVEGGGGEPRRSRRIHRPMRHQPKNVPERARSFGANRSSIHDGTLV